jgi:hypothetical protein
MINPKAGNIMIKQADQFAEPAYFFSLYPKFATQP